MSCSDCHHCRIPRTIIILLYTRFKALNTQLVIERLRFSFSFVARLDEHFLRLRTYGHNTAEPNKLRVNTSCLSYPQGFLAHIMCRPNVFINSLTNCEIFTSSKLPYIFIVVCSIIHSFKTYVGALLHSVWVIFKSKQYQFSIGYFPQVSLKIVIKFSTFSLTPNLNVLMETPIC